MTRTRAQMKADRQAQLIAQQAYQAGLQGKRIRCRERDFPQTAMRYPLRDAEGTYYECWMMPPTQRRPFWSVVCLGGDGFVNQYLRRVCTSEEQARACYDRVKDWATIKRLSSLGFKITN